MSINPYQSPPMTVETDDRQSELPAENCWRGEDMLVVCADSQLPSQCLFFDRNTIQLV